MKVIVLGLAAFLYAATSHAQSYPNRPVKMIAPFAPGVKQLTWSYSLDARAFPLDITLDRANALLEVLIEEPGAQVRAPSLRSQGTATTEGRTFKRFLAQNAPEGEHIRIEVPSGKRFQLCSLSLRLANMIWSMTCSCTVALSIGQSTSTRRSARLSPGSPSQRRCPRYRTSRPAARRGSG